MRKIFVITIVLLSVIQQGQCQWFNPPDKAEYREKEKGFYENVILREVNNTRLKEDTPKLLSCDFNGNYPTNISGYETFWHLLPQSQGNTGTCWCFAATSFFESEIFRLNNKEVDLSEMFFVYWDYVDRAEHFVETRGETYFAQGSESNALKRIMPVYGCVPASVYPGKPEYREYHSHTKMVEEMKTYLEHVKKTNIWNKEQVCADVRAILDNYMGAMPDTFNYEGEHYTPNSFYESLPFKAGDMVSFMSTMSVPYNEKHELVEADNWWHSDEYYNVSLEDFYHTVESAVKHGYTICICGDVSEPGYDSQAEVAIVPDFDIPPAHINASSRELRLYNEATTDDHCIHIVGYQESDDGMWYLIKDSGAGGFDGQHKGYRFFHEDYIRLKMMNIMLHKDAARDVLNKIIKK
ncbi:MAG: C1 family peptidase [Bacteroidota bacterium]|nr:C1 family peptidase [Bacteroidota bacterium]